MSKNSERVIAWRKRTKTKMVAAMGGKCQICSYCKCEDALEFHHIDSSKKDFSFGKLRASPQGVKVLIEELKKCIMLCATCHREVHAGITSIPNDFVKFDENKMLSEAQLRKQIKSQAALVMHEPIDRRKIVLTKEQLNELLAEFNNNKSAVAKYLKVSETAIRKRLKR